MRQPLPYTQLSGLKKRLDRRSAIQFFTVLGCWLLTISIAAAELKIDSIYPTLFKMGEKAEVTILGKGFDENTRVAMSLDTGNAASVMGSVTTPGEATGIAVSGTTAYMANGEAGLQVMDISDPSAPTIIGSVDTPGNATGVAVSGTTAYVSDGFAGLQIIDISNSSAPIIIGSADTPDLAYAVALSGTKAYVADRDAGLQVVDISNPRAPVIIGSVDTPGMAFGVTISGSMAYVSDGWSGLQVIDISTPAAPRLIAAIDTPGSAWADAAFSGTIAYVPDAQAGLQVIDISTPGAPSLIGTLDTPGEARSIAISGTTAYVADNEAGLQIIDISEPKVPAIIGAVNIPDHTVDVVVSGTTVYIANLENGLKVIDISDPTPLTITGSVRTEGMASDVAISGTTAYVADGFAGLRVIDISDSKAPTIIGSIATSPGYAQGLALSGSKAYVAAGWSGLQVIDISNPEAPAIIGAVETPGYAYDVVLSGTIAYVGDFQTGLQVIDISNPRAPAIIGSVSTPGGVWNVAISGTTAYVADKTAGLQVIDISNPRAPVVMGAVNTPGDAFGVVISGAKAYVGDSEAGLQVIDISDPRGPTILGSVGTPGGWPVAILGTQVYMADGEDGVQVIDIADSEKPTIIGSIDTPGSARGFVVSGSLAFVADLTSGLVVVPIPVEVLPITVTGETRITCSLPAPGTVGNYNLRVFNASQSNETKGAVTFLDAEDFILKSDMKAIIVAGGGDYIGNTLWPSTRLVANQAYKTLISQGYTKENIYYLGPHSVDLYPEDGISNDVDAEASPANLSWAINTWALDASELFVFMTDHGKDGTFQLNENEKNFQAETLDAWLDSLQARMSGRVVVVYDACNSGSFIPLLTPPSGKQRVVITSARANERAWFMNEGVNSFSYQFWSSAWLKGNLYDAFLDAKNMMGIDQIALLDADGDGSPMSKNDQTVAGAIKIGRGRSAASLPPSIMEVSGDQNLNGVTSASLWVRLGADDLEYIDKVWAVVVSPDQSGVSSDVPVTDLVSIELSDSNGDGIFEGSYEGFIQNGTYQVIAYAKDKAELYSLPRTFHITQLNGATPDNEKDGGYFVTPELWTKAVLQVPGAPVRLKWKAVGTNLTPIGDQVISGYFYADPDDFAYGSEYNPELFVKIYIAKNGWCNIAFNHVTVDNVTVYSAHHYTGEAQQVGTTLLTKRLVEHPYNGVSIQNTAQAAGVGASASIDAGYPLTSGLWAKAILQPALGPVTLIWKEVGTDMTPSGDKVVSGYFYADPGAFAYGSEFNPEVFVKIYIAASGWCNIAFNHVTVDNVSISSAHHYAGSANQTGTASLASRLVEDSYEGVSVK